MSADLELEPIEQQVGAQQVTSKTAHSSLSTAQSSSLSLSNSISLIKLDELSAFGATKQSRLPTLIKMANSQSANGGDATQAAVSSLPAELSARVAQPNERQLGSLPVQSGRPESDKENSERATGVTFAQPELEADDFEMVDDASHEQPGLSMGPSLPPSQTPKEREGGLAQTLSASQLLNSQNQSLQLGDSLIDMIVGLRNENQSLVRALETNNGYVKERLNEFKRSQEESKRREAQFAAEKAEFEHEVRKLRRQNGLLNERLKSMEAKLRELKLEVSESLFAAHSSQASSVRGGEPDAEEPANLYPTLGEATTLQLDSAGPSRAVDLARMTRDELSKHFDAQKADFYSMDDRLKQCDELEKQLNDMGKRDYEICLLQQQLNIYRQDYRLERMANLDAKIQIEKLKNDIDRLCLERLQEGQRVREPATGAGAAAADTSASAIGGLASNLAPGLKIPAAADAALGKVEQFISKKAARAAAKASRYAAKQARRDERAASRAAEATARAQARAQPSAPHPESVPPAQQGATGTRAQTGASEQSHSGRRHQPHAAGSRHQRGAGVRSEVVSDLLSTANKAMMTGYKMASTGVNLALDKLNEFEQEQASKLAAKQHQHHQQTTTSKQPSAPEYPPLD